MTLPEMLLVRREKLGLSLDKAAELCGVTQTGYKGWERHGSIPKQENWPGIAKFLEISEYEVRVRVGNLSQAEATVLMKAFAPKKASRKGLKSPQPVNQQLTGRALVPA